MMLMTNIFNIFDPSTGFNHSLNWLSSLIFFIFFPYQYWSVPSRYTFLPSYFLITLKKEFKIMMNKSMSNLLIFLTVFFMIFWNNFMSLFPYIFPSSSHMSFCLSLSLTLWLSIMLFSWINYYNEMLSHLLPINTPLMLIPFMIFIELISLFIRPITLSIRLSANMIAGHLLLSLLGSSGKMISNILLIFILLLTQITLYTLEISVSIIQSYVFSILSLLYSTET